MNPIYYAIPFFVLTMLLEWRLLRDHERDAGYTVRDTAASLAMGIGNLVVKFGFKAVSFGLYFLLYEHRVFTIPQTAWAFVLLFFAEDFTYYWFHRSHHEVRFLWAAHENHHSSERYNLSTALRQSWTTPITGFLFWAWLPLVGFHPLMLVVAKTISLLYQYWIHTELIGSMGVFGWVFNTPSHHRVHHGRNALYLDRNHAGILIIWDRLFGTFQAELPEEPVDYGITRPLRSHNPFTIAFHEWRAMFADAAAAKTWRGRIGTFFMPPGWSENDTTKTAAHVRAHAERARQAASLT